MQTTALVNEAYIRLNGYDRTRVVDRKHFLALAAGARELGHRVSDDSFFSLTPEKVLDAKRIRVQFAAAQV